MEHLVSTMAGSDDGQTRTAALVVDPQTGLVMMASSNVLPAGAVRLPERTVRPGKYPWVEHAERAVIYACVKSGVSVDGKAMVCSHFPCADCARAMVMSGIRFLAVAGIGTDVSAGWGESQSVAREILAEAGVAVTGLDFAADPAA